MNDDDHDPNRPTDRSLAFSLNRRAFLGRYAGAIGTLALSHLLEQEQHARGSRATGEAALGKPGRPRPSPDRGPNR